MKRIVIALALITLIGCSSKAQTSELITTGTEAPTTTTTWPVPDGCTPTEPATLETIEHDLMTRDMHISEAFSGQGYVVANLYRPEGRESAEVWLVRDGKLYAISSDANEFSISYDGRDFASASDPPVAGLTACVIGSLQMSSGSTTGP